MRVKDTPIDAIHPYADNPRDNDDAVEPVAESLREFGWQQPIVVDADGTIIAGHTRYKAARRLGMETVPVVVASDLTPEQVSAYRLADNKTAELAEWDMDLLGQELDGLIDFDMGRFGFDDADAEAEPTMDDVVEDAAPEDAPTRCQPGDVWQLGRHRVMCADATDAGAVETLMGGVSVDLWVTDPPYNVAIGSHDGEIERAARKMRKDGALILNDDWEGDEEGFVEFLAGAFSAAMGHLKPGGAFYVWHADAMRGSFLDACDRAGMPIRQVIVWAKNTFTLGRQDYQWSHEPCLYGWRDGAAHYFTDSRRESTVIREDKPVRSELHPTMKPVRLIAYLIANSSRQGEAVLDTFLGSGTTLIACEQLGRTCYGMELDPHYCDVIIERWERYTGGTAVTVES